MRRLALIVPVLLAASASAALATATGPASYGYERLSANWAGYAATAPDGSSFSVGAASGTWRQPKVTCRPADGGAAAATWVGIGGLAGSPSLDQIGTDARCDDHAQATYYAWYEVLPGPGRKLRLTIEPGDTIAASVTLNTAGTEVSLELADTTQGDAVRRFFPIETADKSTAEWIVETPISCTLVACRPAPLADFGTVSFRNVTLTGNGHTGTLADPLWTAVPIRHTVLRSASAPPVSWAGATPTPLADGGAAFSVRWTPSTLPRIALTARSR